MSRWPGLGHGLPGTPPHVSYEDMYLQAVEVQISGPAHLSINPSLSEKNAEEARFLVLREVKVSHVARMEDHAPFGTQGK